MKLLLDQNLPRSLLRSLSHDFPDSEHVINVGLDAVPDSEIYEFARDNGYTILSKDSDFRQLSFLLGTPPKVVWIRIGNCTAKELSALLEENLQLLRDFDTSEESFLIIEP